ncbi:hypothetical protein GCM10007338_08610 [Corynebacterium pelargi]|nr:hypothetical protein GCM10007338_08610 [Corynebacterium pelargi]
MKGALANLKGEQEDNNRVLKTFSDATDDTGDVAEEVAKRHCAPRERG